MRRSKENVKGENRAHTDIRWLPLLPYECLASAVLSLVDADAICRRSTTSALLWRGGWIGRCACSRRRRRVRTTSTFRHWSPSFSSGIASLLLFSKCSSRWFVSRFYLFLYTSCLIWLIFVWLAVIRYHVSHSSDRIRSLKSWRAVNWFFPFSPQHPIPIVLNCL